MTGRRKSAAVGGRQVGGCNIERGFACASTWGGAWTSHVSVAAQADHRTCKVSLGLPSSPVFPDLCKMEALVSSSGHVPYTFALTFMTNTCTSVVACLAVHTAFRLDPPLPRLRWDEVHGARHCCVRRESAGAKMKTPMFLPVFFRRGRAGPRFRNIAPVCVNANAQGGSRCQLGGFQTARRDGSRHGSPTPLRLELPPARV